MSIDYTTCRTPQLLVDMVTQVQQESRFARFFDIGETPCSLWVVALCILALMSHVVYARKKAKRAELPPRTAAAFARKRDFLSRSGEAYGYVTCACGHIDVWRPKELPNLIPPIEILHHVVPDPQVYLDFAGAALPTKSQLEKIMESSQTILANPHSTGMAASRTSLLMEQAKKHVMDHFDCHAGRGFKSRDPIDDCHPGYDVVWTSGATESLRIVSERFPWTACESCGKRSTLVYSQNSHTSVVGMRGPALAKGASFQCRSLSEICSADSGTIERWSNMADAQCSRCSVDTVSNLIVLAVQCNFGGDKANVPNVIRRSRHLTNDSNQWYTMLDLAKAASTEPIDLKALDPDFACISFYKLFGEPTGLGALFVKRSVTNVLMGQSESRGLDRYFGGGSVDVVLPGINFAVGRSGPTPLSSLTNGTVHFRGIASLLHGFDELDRVGGMEQIRKHTSSLAGELARRLKGMRHGNSRPAIVIYGAWANAGVTQMERASLPGPTIAFNVLHDDGHFVGYNEVSKLAALNQPPLQLRTGCFCNPGACQEALQLSDEQVRNNYLTSNHVCGDHIDIINDKPTGAIRASFGKDSIWEDLDSLVTFLENNFVNEGMHTASPTCAPSVSEVALSELYIFPIKSCSAQRVPQWRMHVDSGRLAFDREFALVDSSDTAMRLQAHPRMSLLQPRIDLQTRTMLVSAPGCQDLIVFLDDDQCPNPEVRDSVVQVCGNKCGGRLWGDHEASEWFSSFLGVQCWLARCSRDRYEVAASTEGTNDLRSPAVAFANEAPLLLLSEQSVETLNEALVSHGQRRVNSKHFRPNLVVRSTSKAVSSSDGLPFDVNPEDRWTRLSLKGTTIQLGVVGQCARCSMVDVDPTTGTKGKTLRALADYRRNNGQITFGVFLRSESREVSSEAVCWLKEGDVLKCT
jgi:molybdenum cofactor sulfurtransferase